MKTIDWSGGFVQGSFIVISALAVAMFYMAGGLGFAFVGAGLMGLIGYTCRSYIGMLGVDDGEEETK